MRSEHISLLETMANLIRCEYLSDLHQLDAIQCRRLICCLKAVEPKDVALFEWNDALEYITGSRCAYTDAEQARAALLKALAAPRRRL